jgi:hypothetical protein
MVTGFRRDTRGRNPGLEALTAAGIRGNAAAQLAERVSRNSTRELREAGGWGA